RQLDQLRIGLGPFGAFYVGHFFLYGGSVLPNDRLHKTNYTLNAHGFPDRQNWSLTPPFLWHL
ncbi:hypothetical protein, partial [Collimonas sp.]|uniref:hypothetical protein n=1 Tax=Collimonas sp. TaxID=1963772 RepID=UPI0037C163B0